MGADTFPQFNLPPRLQSRPIDLIALGNAMYEQIIQVSAWPDTGGQQDQAIPLPVYCAGGCATNVACFVSRFGGQVTLIARLGNGRYSQPIWEEYRRSGVDTTYVRQIVGKAGNLVVIMTNPGGDWSVLSYMDPDLEVTSADLPPEHIFSQTKFLYIDGFTLFHDWQKQAVDQAITLARQNGCLIVVDASVPLAESQPDYLAQLFARSDIVFANRVEALAATKMTTVAGAITAFQTLGPQLTFLKRGLDGSVVITPQAVGHIPALKLDIVDTIAAGDAYLAATLISLVQGKSLYDSARRGSAAGALACQGAGSLTVWFTLAEVDRLVKQDKLQLVQGESYP